MARINDVTLNHRNITIVTGSVYSLDESCHKTELRFGESLDKFFLCEIFIDR